MSTHPFARLNDGFRDILDQLQLGELKEISSAKSTSANLLERPRRADLGDIATALPLRISKAAGKPPLAIAQLLADKIKSLPEVAAATAAKPGFVNIELARSARAEAAAQALAEPDKFGRHAQEQASSVLLEFVSSNPTGPLHVGHARAAAYGDSVARILRLAGWQVHTEYYLNDRGRQINILAASLWLRILQVRGEFDAPIPAGCYAGSYLLEVAKQFASSKPDFAGKPITTDDLPAEPDAAAGALAQRVREALGAEQHAELADFAVSRICAGIKQELDQFRVPFDSWFSEASMIAQGKLQPALDRLDAIDATYVQDGATWFRASSHGDEKDRVLVRKDGNATYFASDVGYHLDKYSRGFDRYVNIFGADHHGYVPRLRGFIAALGEDAGRLEVPLVQIVALTRGKERIKMTTRGGVMFTLDELIEAVGVDAARLFFVMQKPNAHMEFDLDLAAQQSSANPVYYIQYAHARCCSVLARWGGDAAGLKLDADLLVQPAEQAVLGEMMWFAQTVRTAADDLAPHLIFNWLYELARKIHACYEGEPILGAAQPLQSTRLALVAAAANGLAAGLTLLGVSSPTKMERTP